MPSTIITDNPALGGEATKPLPALPTPSVSLPKPITQHGLVAGKSVVKGVAGVQVEGTTMHNPSSDISSSSVSIRRAH
jgi:hypothetical protein